jgi:hypothetical protein
VFNRFTTEVVDLLNRVAMFFPLIRTGSGVSSEHSLVRISAPLVNHH